MAPGGYASHTEAVVLRRYEAGHGGAVVFEWMVYISQVGVIVVIEGGKDVAREVLVLVVHSIVHHRHVDAGACVCGPHLLDPDILTGAVAKLVVVVQVPLAAVERVAYAYTPGNAGAAVCEIGVAALNDCPDGVTARVCGILACHLQVVCARV